VINVPKVQLPEQVTARAAVRICLEQRNGLTSGALKLEPMIETPPGDHHQDGRSAIASFIDAAEGRWPKHSLSVSMITTASWRASQRRIRRWSHPTCDSRVR
jgi:hypothetical protein